MPSTPRPVREKVRAHRARRRAAGYRLVQIWAPDVRSAAFREEAHRQSAAVAASEAETADQGFIDSVSEFWDR